MKTGSLDPTVLAIVLAAVVVVALCLDDCALSADGNDVSRLTINGDTYADCRKKARAAIESTNRFGLDRACNSLQHPDRDAAPDTMEWPTYGLWTRKDR